MSTKRINIDPTFWGPKGWFFIDSIVLSYPDRPKPEDQQMFKNFILSLETILPCEGCRYHYGEFVAKNPLTNEIMAKKSELIKWILACHNNVRKNQKKSQFTLEDFYKYYIRENNLKIVNNNIKSSFIETFTNNSSYIILIIMLIISSILLYRRYKN
jgi:hypothetical protein